MQENENVDKFRNGDSILETISKSEREKAAEDMKPVWCCHDNNSDNGKKHSKLTNQYLVIYNRGLVPENWDVPNDAEFTKLTEYLGGEIEAGGKLISTL